MEKGAVFRVTVTIANEVYTEELADNTSVQFKKLSKEPTAIITDIFKTKVRGFRRVEIISFRRGSDICVFKVITEKSKASVDKIEDVLTEASKNGKAGKYIFKDVNVEQETAEATKPLSTGIASICSETSSKAKTSQILKLSTRESRSFRTDMYVTSSSLFSTTAPISKSPQPTSESTTSATSFKTQTEPSPSQSSGVTPTTTRFHVTMTITNRDYRSSLGDKESQEFQNLATEVRSAAKSSDSVNFTSSQRSFISETSSIGSLRPTESSMTFRKDQTTLRPTLSTIAFPSISTANSTDRSIHLSTTRTSIDMSPTSVSTTSATSFRTQTEPSPSQSSGVTPTTTISPTTPKPEVSLKRFNVTMTITNRD